MPAIRVLGTRGAIAFATLTSCWLLLARAFVAGMLAHLLLGERIGPRMAITIANAVVDIAALCVTLDCDPRLMWSTAAVIVFSELFYRIAGWRGRSMLRV